MKKATSKQAMLSMQDPALSFQAFYLIEISGCGVIEQFYGDFTSQPSWHVH
jgi:hypothetical protein